MCLCSNDIVKRPIYDIFDSVVYNLTVYNLTLLLIINEKLVYLEFVWFKVI